jgi:hypothetical protein
MNRAEEPLGDVVNDVVCLLGIGSDHGIEIGDGFDRGRKDLQRLVDETSEETLYIAELGESILGCDAVHDVDCEVSRSFDLVQDPGHSDQETQVRGDRLLERQNLERALFEDAVELVDRAIAGAHDLDEIESVLNGGLTRTFRVLENARSHVYEAASNLVEFVIEVVAEFDFTLLVMGVFRMQRGHGVS